MARHFDDWLKSFCDYAQYGEAPRRMYFWSGVSALAGALRRRVWIDQFYFRWYPNFYIVLVAPPGIVSKSTTAGVSMSLLRRVPGIKFGPDVVTWQALVSAFAAAGEGFSDAEGNWTVMCPLTIESSEFGNLLNPTDRDMVDLLVSLWDGRTAFNKVTKMSGNDAIENPWINLIACTTPAWIAGNFPDYMIGGGFTSRCLFVFAEEKDHYVAYPGLNVPADIKPTADRLVGDLEHIATKMCGEYKLDSDAITWGTAWYEHHYRNRPVALDDDRFGGYIARKQTHIHKTAMILAASQRDDLVILKEDLSTANDMVTDLETDMPRVFSRIGQTQESLQVDRLLHYVKMRKRVSYEEAYRFLHSYFPLLRDLENIVSGALKAGLIRLENDGSGGYYLESVNVH